MLKTSLNRKAHKTGSRQNFAKICGPKFFSENSDQVDKFSEISIFENRKFREFSAGTRENGEI